MTRDHEHIDFIRPFFLNFRNFFCVRIIIWGGKNASSSALNVVFQVSDNKFNLVGNFLWGGAERGVKSKRFPVIFKIIGKN